MLGLYVRGKVALVTLGRRLKQEEQGLTAIEYGVFAAFMVLALTGVALFAGPQIKQWMMESLCGIMNKHYTAGAASCS